MHGWGSCSNKWGPKESHTVGHQHQLVRRKPRGVFLSNDQGRGHRDRARPTGMAWFSEGNKVRLCTAIPPARHYLSSQMLALVGSWGQRNMQGLDKSSTMRSFLERSCLLPGPAESGWISEVPGAGGVLEELGCRPGREKHDFTVQRVTVITSTGVQTGRHAGNIVHCMNYPCLVQATLNVREGYDL